MLLLFSRLLDTKAQDIEVAAAAPTPAEAQSLHDKSEKRCPSILVSHHSQILADDIVSWMDKSKCSSVTLSREQLECIFHFDEEDSEPSFKHRPNDVSSSSSTGGGRGRASGGAKSAGGGGGVGGNVVGRGEEVEERKKLSDPRRRRMFLPCLPMQ